MIRLHLTRIPIHCLLAVAVAGCAGGETRRDAAPAASTPAASGPATSPSTRPASPYADSIRRGVEYLVSSQQPDGSWPITWDPPGATSAMEWRGILTLWAVRILVAHGRLAPEPPQSTVVTA